MEESKLAVPQPLVEDSWGLLIARSLVDLQGGCIPVRMANLSTEPIRLQNGHPLGELLDSQDEILRVRGIGCCSKMAISDEDSASSLSIEEANDRTADVETSEVQLPDPETEAQDLPEYLRALYITTAQGIQVPSIRQQLRVMLCQRKMAFAQHKLDLGRFSGISHEINSACVASVWERVWPTFCSFKDEEQKCLEEQLEAGGDQAFILCAGSSNSAGKENWWVHALVYWLQEVEWPLSKGCLSTAQDQHVLGQPQWDQALFDVRSTTRLLANRNGRERYPENSLQKQTKLHTPWVGPYIVRKNLSDCLLLISDKRRTYAAHHNLLKPCTDECCPKSAQIRTST